MPHQKLSKWGMPHRVLLENAELQFKLALAIQTTCHLSDRPDFNYLASFSYGKHTAEHGKLMLTKEQEAFASILLAHSTTYLCAVQIDSVLGEIVPNRFQATDPNIRSASWIVRLIRNAFTHNPFAPVWETYPECENQTYSVRDMISLETTGLNGKPVVRKDYGGPLALLRLLHFVKTLLPAEPAASLPTRQ